MMISEHADPVASPGANEAGGQNVYVYHLAKELARMGWEVDVFTRWDNRMKKQVVRFAQRARVIRIRSGPRNFIARDHLFKYLPEFADNIIAFKTENNLSYKLIHAHYWMSGWSALKVGQLWNIPVVTTYHSLGYVRYHTLKNYQGATANNSFFKFRVKWEKELAHKSSVLATSPYEKDDLIKHYQATPSKIAVIPCGIDLKLFQPIPTDKARKKLDLNADETIVLYAGRLEWRKGIATLLHALPKLIEASPELKNSIKLVIVGRKTGSDSTEAKRLKEITSQLKLSKQVAFVGSRDQSQLKYFYSAANVCVVPSYYEPFGIVPLEAFACQCPVIASRIGGLQYTVHDKQNGLLVAPRNPTALASALREIINDNKHYKDNVRRFSKTTLLEKFAWSKIAKSVDRFYAKLIKNHT